MGNTLCGGFKVKTHEKPFIDVFDAQFISLFFRAINNGILDTYQLKSLDALLGE